MITSSATVRASNSTMDSYALRSVSDLPAPFRSTFNFRYFNSLQSECFPGCFLSDINMVISAPTGSGKTVLFELCILRLLSKFLSREGKFNHVKGTLKTIYIAPSKALVQEKLRDWNLKLGSFGINCVELTGDNDSYNTKNIQEVDIILTTPEKFDAVTRYRIRDGGLSFFSDISLVLIDEVHLLNDPRGAALEAVVSRVKMLSRRPEMNSCPLAIVRFVAVSATIPNIRDIAEWLMVPEEGIKRFGEEMRPIKLTTKVFGYTAARNDFLFEKRLQNFIFGKANSCAKLLRRVIFQAFVNVFLVNVQEKLNILNNSPDILMQHSRGKSALVFCSTRKGAQDAAQCLSQTAMGLGLSNPFIKCKEQQDRLKEASLLFSDKQMQSCILYGVGYHNGGLCQKDRNLIEGLFLKGDLQVLCTTNTLAHGINLPAHTVVIKSTQFFNKEKGQYSEYERSMVLQMCGRAGRPPFDDTGTVIIMTRKETVHLYENLLNGCEMVESQLLSCTVEHLNAEIVQLSVPDISLAIEWLKCSYLFVRIKKNPEYYGIKKGIPWERLEKHLQEICVQNVNELSTCGMIWTDEYGFLLKPLVAQIEPGRLMTKYYLTFDTMKGIMQTPDACNLKDALFTVCHSKELAWIQLRRNEKKLLNDINMDKDGRLRFHILGDNGKRKKRIQTREEKIFVLANDCLTGDPSIHDLSLTQDTNSICSNGCRIAKCMKECFIYRKKYNGTLNSSILAKSLHQRLWNDSPYLLKQLPGIGMVTAKALHSAGISCFSALEEADPRRIEMVTGRKYPFGNHIKDTMLSLPPKVEIKVQESGSQKSGKSKLVITLIRLSHSSMKRHYADMVVGSEDDKNIYFHEKIRVEEFTSPYSTTILISRPENGKVTVRAHLIFEEFLGLDVHGELVIGPEILLTANGTKRNQQHQPIYSCPKEIYIVEDDDMTSDSAGCSKKHDSLSFERAISSAPSFDLLPEEDTGDGVIDIADCQAPPETITEQTVFDHIRKKAKYFPVLLTSVTTNIPLSEASSRGRKESWTRDSKEIQEIIVLPDSEPMETPIRNGSTRTSTSEITELSFGLDSGESIEVGNDIPRHLPIIGKSRHCEDPELSTETTSTLTDQIYTDMSSCNEVNMKDDTPSGYCHDMMRKWGRDCSDLNSTNFVGNSKSGVSTEVSCYLTSQTEGRKSPNCSQLLVKDEDKCSWQNILHAITGSDERNGSTSSTATTEVRGKTEASKALSDLFFVKEDIGKYSWPPSFPPKEKHEHSGEVMDYAGKQSGEDIFLQFKSVFSFL